MTLVWSSELWSQSGAPWGLLQERPVNLSCRSEAGAGRDPEGPLVQYLFAATRKARFGGGRGASQGSLVCVLPAWNSTAWNKTWTQTLRAEVGLLFLSVPRRGGPRSSEEEGTAGRPVGACRQPLAAIFSEPTSSPLPGLASMHMTLKKQRPGDPENGAQLQTPDSTGCGG